MSVDWHTRFIEQARWTKALRDYLLGGIKFTSNAHCLEIGSGTGVIAADFATAHSCTVIGVDLDFPRSIIATRNYGNIFTVNGNAYHLPFPNDSFDCVFCHYFFLWIDNVDCVMDEVRRVLKPGGRFIAFAEPDYHGRIDHPPAFQELGELQTQALMNQGINPNSGRELPSFAANHAFTQVIYGISGYEQSAGVLPAWWESEWYMLDSDLSSYIPKSTLDELQILDRDSWLNGSRVLWIPTFYLSCIKPYE